MTDQVYVLMFRGMPLVGSRRFEGASECMADYPEKDQVDMRVEAVRMVD